MICGSPSGTSEFSHGNSTPLCLLEVYTATHLSEPNFITQLSAVKPRLGIGTGYTKHKRLVQCIGIHIGHKLKAEWNIAVPHGNLHITTLADIQIKSSHYLCLDIMATVSAVAVSDCGSNDLLLFKIEMLDRFLFSVFVSKSIAQPVLLNYPSIYKQNA